MNTSQLFDPDHRSKAPVVFIFCLVVMVGAAFLASRTQKDFGTIDVSNVTYINYNGIVIRAKLLRPQSATPSNPAPGIVYVHGYQNNRETSDAYCIELARRGIVALEIDAIGRGNSGIPGKLDEPDFDPTWGGRTSLAYLKKLPFVDNQKNRLDGSQSRRGVYLSHCPRGPDCQCSGHLRLWLRRGCFNNYATQYADDFRQVR